MGLVDKLNRKQCKPLQVKGMKLSSGNSSLKTCHAGGLMSKNWKLSLFPVIVSVSTTNFIKIKSFPVSRTGTGSSGDSFIMILKYFEMRLNT